MYVIDAVVEFVAAVCVAAIAYSLHMQIETELSFAGYLIIAIYVIGHAAAKLFKSLQRPVGGIGNTH